MCTELSDADPLVGLPGAARAQPDLAKLSDEEAPFLHAHYEEDQILEILLLCGFDRTVAYVSNGLALPLEPTAARFPA